MRKQHVYQCRQTVDRAKAVYILWQTINLKSKKNYKRTTFLHSNNLEELYKKIRNKNKLINEKKIKRIYNQ